MIRRSVLLPEPLGPIRPSDSPRSRWTSTPRRAHTSWRRSRCRGWNRASTRTFRSKVGLCRRTKRFETPASSRAPTHTRSTKVGLIVLKTTSPSASAATVETRVEAAVVHAGTRPQKRTSW